MHRAAKRSSGWREDGKAGCGERPDLFGRHGVNRVKQMTPVLNTAQAFFESKLWNSKFRNPTEA